MSNCSTPTCQIDGRIRPMAPAGAAMSVSNPGNPSGGCVGRGRSSNRSGRRTGATVTQGFLAGIAPSPVVPAQPAVPAQPPPSSVAPLPVRQPPGSVLMTPVQPPADMPVTIATGIGYPVAPTFVQGVPVGAVMTIPRPVDVVPTTISGMSVPAALDSGKGVVAQQPAPPSLVVDSGKGVVAQQPALSSVAALDAGARASTLGGAATPPLPPLQSALAPTASFQVDPKVLLAATPRPAGAPQAFDPEGCVASFAALPLLDQARVFEDGRIGAYSFAQAVARDLRRGFAASGPAGVAWLFRSFQRQSPEVRDFCAAVSAASVAPAGAAFAPPSAKAAPALGAPYVAPKALPLAPAPQRADDVHACLDALHVVSPLTFGRSMPFARVSYTTADGSLGLASLLDNSYSAGVWRALSNPATPYAEGVSLRDGYIAVLRRSVASADADVAYRNRSLALRAVIRQLCAVLFPERYGEPTGVLPAGEVDMDFSNDPTVPGSTADPWAALRGGGGLGPAVDNTTGVRFDPATGQPMRQPADPTAAVMGGIGQVTQQGLGVLGAYLTGEAQRDAARYTADAQRAAATATAQSAAEVARINADRDLRIAELTAQMRVAQQSGADASTTSSLAQQIAALQAQIAAQPQPQPPAVVRQPGMSTGAMVGLGAAGVAAVGGIVYLATRRKSNGYRRRRAA